MPRRPLGAEPGSGAGLQLQALEMRTLLDRTGTVLLCDSTLAVLLTVVVVIAARFMWIYPAADSALAEPIARTAGRASALAVAFLSRVCRRAWRRFASGGNCTPFPPPAFA